MDAVRPFVTSGRIEIRKKKRDKIVKDNHDCESFPRKPKPTHLFALLFFFAFEQ